jgi:hypothetical protein
LLPLQTTIQEKGPVSAEMTAIEGAKRNKQRERERGEKEREKRATHS